MQAGGVHLVVAYVVLIAVVNISLGFAVAVYLGRRYRELLALDIDPTLLSLGDGLPAVADAPSTAETPPGSTRGAPAPEEPATPASDAPIAQEPPAEPVACPPAPEEPQDAPRASPAPEAPREDPPRNNSAGGTLEEFREQVVRYEGQLSDVDDQLRICAAAPETGKIETCLSTLRQSNKAYRDACAGARQRLSQGEPEDELCQSILQNIQAMMDSMAAQVDSTRAAVESFDYQGDLPSGCRRMLDETAKLANANYKVRDALGEADAALAPVQQRPDAAERAAQTDALTGIASRAGLEAGLAQWWQDDAHRARDLCAAMIDVDQFARVNEGHGHKLGDRVLRALAQLLTSEGRNNISARFSGQRFLVLFPDADLRATVQFVERIRQTVEMSRLQHQGQAIRITVSCGVTEATSDEASETLFARAEAALLEAKRYGRNRTFIHEGKYPTPVVPPNLSLEERSIAL